MTTQLDLLLPEWDFAERHQVRLADGTGDAVTAAEDLRWSDVPLFRTALTVLSLGRARPPADDSVVGTMTSGGFRVLARTPGEFVVGSVVRMTPPAGAVDLDRDPAGVFAAFRDFSEPEHYRVALNFRREGDVLATATRVSVADAASRRRFAAYWFAIRVPGGLVRREWLAGARRTAGQ